MFSHHKTWIPPSLLLVLTLYPALGTCTSTSTRKIASAWYASWHAADVPHAFPLSSVSWEKYTHMAYALATTSDGLPGVLLQSSDEELLPQFVKTAHENNVTAILTIGGWTGSQYFSALVGSPANRTAFTSAITNVTSTYSLDGVELDWEYPGTQGIGCNVVSSDDTANLLLFLQQLRQDSVGKDLVVSMPTFLDTFVDGSGQPSGNVSAFGEVLDYITIMDYDVATYLTDLGRGPNGVGPNSPINSSCSPSDHTLQGSAVEAVGAWTAAGFPREKVVLGVASYGHSFHVDKSAALVPGPISTNTSTSASASSTATSDYTLAAFPPYNASEQPAGDAWDGTAGTDICGNPVAAGGVWDFWGLIDGGFLDEAGNAKEGIVYRFDECSETPYVYNTATEVMVSYDNAQSFAVKGSFIVANGLAGFAMWEAGGDNNDTLLDAINAAITSTPPPSSIPGSSSGSGTISGPGSTGKGSAPSPSAGSDDSSSGASSLRSGWTWSLSIAAIALAYSWMV